MSKICCFSDMCRGVPECVDAGWVGNCVQISDCTTGEWVFGVRESPVCKTFLNITEATSKHKIKKKCINL